jgi:hypothetical protein
MKFSNYLGECSAELAQAKELPSDRWIKPLLQLAVLERRISDEFSYDDIRGSELRGESTIKMACESFRRELEDIRASMDPEIRMSRTYI